MTTTPPEAPPGGPAPDAGPRVTADEVRDLGRLRRSRTNRKVAGVAGGLARHLDVDPVILRVAFVVLVFFGGAGLILYAACWLLVPEEGSPTAPLHLDDRSRSVALVIAGVIALAALVGHSLGRFGFPWPLALVALAAVLYLTRRDARRAAEPHPESPQWQSPQWESPRQAPSGTWPPPAPEWRPAPPRSSRKQGPVLFWFTLALVALAEGALGTAHLAGAPVTPSAYPALALGITGVVLLVGAFWGRAGGLILLGLLSAAGLGLTSVAENVDATTLRPDPTSAAQVHGSYAVSAGEVVLDLTGVSDPAALDGRTIRLSGDIGRLEVIVPPGLDVLAHARVNGPGNIRLFGGEEGGVDLRRSASAYGGAGAPHLTIDARLDVGQIEVHQ